MTVARLLNTPPVPPPLSFLVVRFGGVYRDQLLGHVALYVRVLVHLSCGR